MDYFEAFGLSWIDGLIIIVVGIAVFLVTTILYPPLIKFLIQKNWVGYDIHKKSRPATAESGGIGLTVGMLFGMVMLGIVYPELWNEIIVFIITIVTSAVIGIVDDAIRLSSIKKIVFMILSGFPLFFLNYFGFIHISSPTLPILGHLRLTIIYPFLLPFIITILTNTVNMLEGYNGEGSGSTVIALVFIIISAIIARSVQGVMYAVPVLASIFAFYRFNRFPAKVFPGDIGTLVIGAAIGMVGILGSLEVVMVISMLAHVFNSFYVLASIRGFKESHDIKKKDIWMDDQDHIHASDEDHAAMTLPRLLTASGPISEPILVQNILALCMVSGIFAIFSEIVRQWTLDSGYINLVNSIIIIGFCVAGYLFIIWKFPRIRGITWIMMLLLLIGAFVLALIDQFVLLNPLNWLISFILAGIVLGGWYYISIRYFWTKIDRMKKQPGYISTAEHKNQKKNPEE